ncbi:porin family protein [Brumimicrobium mesophilum]|uniref:hypothetical protein n=1 Tax=Brumimicrobium mesophilum TaxID=392717 RepID=UPI000D13F311|nr:hypothetical protein [Brumimicrobium mesophilum]
MKLKRIALIISLIVFANFSMAQTPDAEFSDDVLGGFIIMPIEIPVIDNSDLNTALSEFGFPSLNHPTINFGIGLQLYTNRWITNFSFIKTAQRKSSETFSTEAEYRSTSLSIGYDLIKNYRYSIYPYIGFKGYGLNYLYREKSASETNFNDYFNNPLEYKEFHSSRANLDLGIGASFQWFFLINLRAGYLLPFENASWRINNNNDKLGDSPGLDYNYYFSLTIGLGGITSDAEARRPVYESEL